MPHEFFVGAFEPGDDDLGDFMLDIWLPFARDDAKWVDNRAPVVGTRPNIEVWTHRGTTIAPESPFVFFHTSDRHLHIFTGTGVDLGEESYDQPGNPANAPRDASFTVPSSGVIGNTMRCCFINSAVGPYQGYWLFSDTTGEYIHCVLKVNSRQYRHFSVGRLRQLDGGPDLAADSFYITSHFWASLDPEGLGLPLTPGANEEHAPYDGDHRIPFRGNFFQDGSFGTTVINTIPGFRAYIPGYDGHAYDWYQLGNGAYLTGLEGNATKAVGTINTSVTIGMAQSNYYDHGLGAVLFSCDRNFSANSNPLIPVYIGINRTFLGATRLGPVATVPDVYRVNMRDFAPEETISIQGNDYKVFPVINKDAVNVLAGEGYSGYEGLAYRVETGVVP
jgi:hypothetical protein